MKNPVQMHTNHKRDRNHKTDPSTKYQIHQMIQKKVQEKPKEKFTQQDRNENE